MPNTSRFDANELTRLLYDAGIVSRKEVRGQPDTPTGIPAFQLEVNRYVFRADVSRSSGWGSLDVTVDYAPGTAADCAALSPTFGDCEVVSLGDAPVAISEWHGPDGESRNFAFTVLGDGTRIAAVASNVSYSDSKAGRTPTNPQPVLNADQLSTLVVKVGVGGR
jgi:hypothetical protein